MRLQPLILQGSVSKGTTKSVGASISFSSSFHDEFSGGAGSFPIDAEALVNQCLLGIRAARLAHLDDPPIRERQVCGRQVVGTQQASDGLPVAHVSALREPVANPAQEVLSQDTDENVPIDPPFQLMKVGPQSERAFQRTEALFRTQQRHVEFPQFGAIEVVIGFEHVVAAKFQRGFEPTVIALNP